MYISRLSNQSGFLQLKMSWFSCLEVSHGHKGFVSLFTSKSMYVQGNSRPPCGKSWEYCLGPVTVALIAPRALEATYKCTKWYVGHGQPWYHLSLIQLHRNLEDFYPHVRNVRIHLNQDPRRPYTRDIRECN